MKNKTILLCFSIFFFLLMLPFSTHALTINEMPPKVYIEGMKLEDYLIDKKITEKEVIITLKKKNSSIEYSWEFDKEKITSEIRLNFSLSFDSPNKDKIDALTKDNEKLYLSFSHHGNLPSRAKIRVFVGEKYSNGEKLYLYYFNEEENVIEYVDHELEVKDGYITFEIDHCSDYFLTTTIVTDAINNPKSMNYIIMVMFGVVIVLVGATIFSTKR